MDAQRALLDELMGRNRNGDKPDLEIADFRDTRVCRRYLCGLCPHDLFQNTKMDLGDCPKLHAPKLKLAYERDPRAREYGYEQELEKELVKIVAEIERKIARSQARLEEQDGERAPSLRLDVDNCQEVMEITTEIQSVLEQAEDAGDNGDVELSLELMAKVDDLAVKRSEVKAAAMVRSFRPVAVPAPAPTDTTTAAPEDSEKTALTAQQNVNQKLRVCDVCGAFLSIFDSDRRLADHFGGKLHLGYLQIRKKIEQLATERRKRPRIERGMAVPPEPRRDQRSRSRSRTRRDDRSSRRDRSRDRDRVSSRRSRRHRSTSASRSRSRGRRR